MSVLDRLSFLLVTGCGLGLAPYASGTVGTLGGIALAVVLQQFAADTTLAIWLAVAAAILLAVGCSMTAFTARTFKRKDPGAFVLDEIVGYLVALAMFVAVWGTPGWMAHTACFFLFRVFDVHKTFPANRLEMIPGAPGIMLDDVMAGVYAGAALLLVAQFVQL